VISTVSPGGSSAEYKVKCIGVPELVPSRSSGDESQKPRSWKPWKTNCLFSTVPLRLENSANRAEFPTVSTASTAGHSDEEKRKTIALTVQSALSVATVGAALRGRPPLKNTLYS